MIIVAEHGPTAQLVHNLAARASATVGHLSAKGRMLPSFLIVGAQRCGTTALYSKLVQHPGVVGPNLHKGVHYFDTDYERGLGWYQGHFPLLSTARRIERRSGIVPITGEASPYYMFHPLAGERIARDLPGVNLIAILRDPVERAYSAYTHEKARGFETEPFERAIELEVERLSGEEERLRTDPTYVSKHHQHNAYLARGRYVEQVRRLESLVGERHLLVLDFEDVFADVRRTMPEILEFLQLPSWEQDDIPRRNARPRTEMPGDTRSLLEKYYLECDEELARWWGRTPSWRR